MSIGFSKLAIQVVDNNPLAGLPPEPPATKPRRKIPIWVPISGGIIILACTFFFSAILVSGAINGALATKTPTVTSTVTIVSTETSTVTLTETITAAATETLTVTLPPTITITSTIALASTDTQAPIATLAPTNTPAPTQAVHRALYYPESLILLVSASLRQSSELFKKAVTFLDRLPDKPDLPEDNKLSCTLANGSRIISLPSNEATIRGFSGAGLIIEDESARVGDDLYYAVRPMLAVSGGQLILMSTPFGKRGHFFQEWTKGGPIWERIESPATDNPRISKEFLAEERASMGDWWFQQEYMCQFGENIDSVFSYDLVMSALSANVTPLFPDTPSAITEDVEPLFAEV